MKRKFNREKATHAFKRVAQMPPLLHSLPGEEFDIMKSEVVRWLRDQPTILQAMFDYWKDSGAIVFNRETGQWKGCETP